MNSTSGEADVLLLAAADSVDAVPGLVSYGGLGILAMAAIAAVRVLFARETAAMDRERTRADRLEEEVRRLNRDIHDQYIPTLTKATEVMSQTLQSTRRERDR